MLVRFLWPRRRTPKDTTQWPPVCGVSIIKPLSGANDTLEECLETCFKLKLPRFELLFCVSAPDDAAVPVVERLMARYPAVDAQLLVGEAALEGASPKVRNAAKGYEKSRYDLFWMMDAKIRTSAEDALSMMALLQRPSVGLVHQLPWFRTGSDLSAVLERMFFAGIHARSYCFINGLGLPCTNGMSIMCKRSSWTAIGGCEALAATVAEDSLFGILMQAKGYSCAMAALPCVQNAPPLPLRSIVERRARWYQLKLFEMDGGRWVAPFEFWLEHASLVCLVAAGLWHFTERASATLLGAAGALVLCAVIDLGYSLLIDLVACADVGPSRLGFRLIALYPAAWLINLLLPFWVMVKGLSSSSIVWNANGTLKPMHNKPYSEKPAEQTIAKVMGWRRNEDQPPVRV